MKGENDHWMMSTFTYKLTLTSILIPLSNFICTTDVQTCGQTDQRMPPAAGWQRNICNLYNLNVIHHALTWVGIVTYVTCVTSWRRHINWPGLRHDRIIIWWPSCRVEITAFNDSLSWFTYRKKVVLLTILKTVNRILELEFQFII